MRRIGGGISSFHSAIIVNFCKYFLVFSEKELLETSYSMIGNLLLMKNLKK